MLKTRNYVNGINEFVVAGETYYWGELWDGSGDGEELLESGAIMMYDDSIEYDPYDDSNWILVDFEIVETNDEILKTLVRITNIG